MGESIEVKSPEQLRAINTVCKREAASSEEILRTVRDSIFNSGWNSPAADRFKQDWELKFEPVLKELGPALESLGQAADGMATNYEQTEASYKGGS